MSGLKRKAPTDIEPSSFEQELKRIHQTHGLSKTKTVIISSSVLFLGKSKESWARPELKSISPRENSLGTKVDIVAVFKPFNIMFFSLTTG